MGKIFTKTMMARWQDCYPAGIIYYPKYFELTSALIEDWFEEALGIAYADLRAVRHLGLPTVRVTCEFAKPCKHGARIALSLAVKSLGRRSFTLSFRGRVDGSQCLHCEQTLGMISQPGFRAVDILGDLRGVMELYLASDSPRNGVS